MKTFNVFKIDSDLFVNQLKPKDYLEEVKTKYSSYIDNAKFNKKDIDRLLAVKIPLKSTTK